MPPAALDLTDDIKPISEFRANAAALLKQVQATGRPMVITQHGRSAAVLVDVQSYQQMTEELDTLRDIAAARAQYAAGGVTSHSDLMGQALARLKQ